MRPTSCNCIKFQVPEPRISACITKRYLIRLSGHQKNFRRYSKCVHGIFLKFQNFGPDAFFRPFSWKFRVEPSRGSVAGRGVLKTDRGATEKRRPQQGCLAIDVGINDVGSILNIRIGSLTVPQEDFSGCFNLKRLF